MADVAGFFKKTLPNIAAMVASGMPGPIGAAAQLVKGLLGKDVAADPQAIMEAVSGATPEQIIELRKLDNEHAEVVQKMGFDNAFQLAQLGVQDRDSARRRQMALRDRIPAILAITITIGFFGSLYLIGRYGVADRGHDVIVELIGSLGAAFVAVWNYYFGSSVGSDKKTEIIAASGK